MDTNITETQFIAAEVAVWGEEYIDDLINRGYTPILTTAGWRWFAPTTVASNNVVEAGIH